MEIAGIFDTNEQTVGYRLAGIKTFLVRNQDELLKRIEELKKDKNIGILIFNENTYKMAGEEIANLKKNNLPLILKI
jgi:vacuolar-type H+-ATPase subunit F/Vma7